MTAACSALLVTLYVSNDCAVYFAAVFAVAHSPTAGGLSHVLDVGAIDRIWASVMVVSDLVLVLWMGWWRGWAVVRPRVRRRVRGERRCILCIVEDGLGGGWKGVGGFDRLGVGVGGNWV